VPLLREELPQEEQVVQQEELLLSSSLVEIKDCTETEKRERLEKVSA
jgi:hypothetical protein